MDQQAGKTKIFIIGQEDYSDELINTIVEKSSLFFGGYIVIVPVEISKNDQKIENLKSCITKGCPNAIHFLNTESKSQLLPSELVKLEGAKAIFFIGSSLKIFLQTDYKKQLIKAVQKAYQNGSALIFVKQTARLLGEKIIIPKNDNTGDENIEDNVTTETIKGLNILPGYIIEYTPQKKEEDKNPVYRHIEKTEFSAILIKYGDAVYIENNELFNIGTGEILIQDKRSGLNEQTWIKIGKRKSYKLK